MSLRLQGGTTMRATGSVLVVVIWSVTAGTMATKCGQTSLLMVSPTNPVWGQKVILTCNAPCSLSDNQNHTYIGYKNGYRLVDSPLRQYTETSYYTHSYSCAVNGSEDLRSPVVCILGKSCFNVTYTHQTISALIGSTVDLPCTYQHPNNHTVIEMNWYIQGERNKAPTNLKSLPEYSGRVKYLGDNVSDCTLRITDLRETDSAEYKFRCKFTLSNNRFAEWGYSFSGTTLTVSGHALLSPWVPVVTVGAVLTVAVLLVTIYCTLRRRSTGGSDATTDPQSVHPDPNSDMYSALNMRNRSTDYDTLNTHPLTNQQIDAEPHVYENL
ncbi:uncharacterized protein LOC117594841 isoform X3 [Esox lucius]|uniref:uncharacterized protein LOC117594841 isoform X3 n=2 Tax=Esox lucius TaxID=8010 RepID=UPI00147712DE|nr:uncharacterized protein LOC117594841 isoform X3 [Esox lucius]